MKRTLEMRTFVTVLGAVIALTAPSCAKEASSSREKELELELELARTRALEAEANAARPQSQTSPAPRPRHTDQAAAPALVPSQRVVDAFETLSDGTGKLWRLTPGRYRATMSAAGDGATLTWIGASCGQATKQTQSFQADCTLDATGQLQVQNPGMGLGASVVVTVTVDRLE